MVNHPARSKADPGAKFRRILNKHQHISKIDAHITRYGFVLRAWPEYSHPLVAKRREDAFATAIAASGKADFSLSEASRITEGSMAEVASTSAKTLDEAIEALTAALDEACCAPSP